MASIRSVLIKNCMSNVQKEISQLEHWLINLSDDNESSTINSCPCSCKMNNRSSSSEECTTKSSYNDLQNIYKSLENLSTMLNAQQITIAHLVNRMEMIEDIKEVHIREQVDESDDSNDLWMNEPLAMQQNEIVYDTLPEITYHVNKENKEDSEQNNIPSASIETTAPVIDKMGNIVPLHRLHMYESSEENKPIIDENKTDQKEVVQEKVVEQVVKKVEVVEEEEVVEEVVEEEEEEEEVVEEVVEEEEEVEVVEEEQEGVEEEVEVVEEEEEEEGIELEEIEFNGITYYKDSDKLVYTIDEEEQPSEMAVGYWKEKSQSVVFYKTK